MATRFFQDEEVINIRRGWDNRTLDVRTTADDFGVSPETIRRIGRRDTYRHVGMPGFRSSDHRTSGPGREEIPQDRITASLERFKKLMTEEPEEGGLGNLFEE